jgi:competence protein ComEC
MKSFNSGILFTTKYIIFFFLLADLCFSQEIREPILAVHFIDVGQGDAILIDGANFTILIDAGRHDRDDVLPYLKNQNITTIDLLIGTHPHADHIGQFAKILEEYTVKEVWMSGDLHTSLTFERSIDAILASKAYYHEPRAGEFHQFGMAHLEILHPVTVNGSYNEGSIVFKLTYGNISFLFTGDAEFKSEQEILETRSNLKSTILKIGHHGSKSSSTQRFLTAVSPEIAIYSSGLENSYGHPHPEVIDRFERMDIPVFGTDKHGTIMILTNGTEYEVVLSAKVTNSSEKSTKYSCVDLNTAERSELRNIIHMEESRIDQLINLRPFSSINQLTKINGIGAKRLEDIQLQQLLCTI